MQVAKGGRTKNVESSSNPPSSNTFTEAISGSVPDQSRCVGLTRMNSLPSPAVSFRACKLWGIPDGKNHRSPGFYAVVRALKHVACRLRLTTTPMKF